MNIMEREKFLALSASEIAELVHQASASQVCVFPINGSRRWYMLEHGQEALDDPAQDSIEVIGQRQIELVEMCFAHGLDTLVMPIFGDDLLNRGDDYTQNAIGGISRLATHPDYLCLYQKQDVRVHFYGDYRKRLANTPYAYLSNLFEHISKHTAHHTRHRLFYGLFASDATETIAEMSVRHFQNTGQVPTRRALAEQYYGEYIEKANLFIGFEKFSVSDYPMLGNGEESLYFTATPSLYMNERQIRNILYDHIYLRHLPMPDYSGMTRQEIDAMRAYYQSNRETAYGVGEIRGGIWYPEHKNHK